VTQFEALTAAAYHELARRGVEVAVVEAGLGGRYDATNVIPSKVQVLTSVGLEHTRWLGPTVADIAEEKLDVVRQYATLVLPAELDPAAEAVAERVAGERHARVVRAPAEAEIPLRALGRFQRANFAVARTAAAAFLGSELDAGAVARGAAEVEVPGRMQVVGERPLVIHDGAHNPAGAAALADALPDVVGDRRLVPVIGVLDDKDAAGMLRALLPLADAAVFTRSRNPRSLPPATLVTLAAQLGGPPAEAVADPRAAVDRARHLAGPDGAVVATGSIYLIADLVREVSAARVSRL
jgi:dihydrofolate synthase/folylpolyglutamate synthase